MKKRKILNVAFLFLLVFGLFNVKDVKAEEIDKGKLTIIKAADNDTQLKINITCGSYTSHRMVSKGTGYVGGKTNYLIANGACFQCSRCNLVFICEGDLLNINGFDNTIGRYITQAVEYEISNYGTIDYQVILLQANNDLM